MLNTRKADLGHWDLFISHASEDKEALVRPLAQLLQDAGVQVWFDEFSLTIGDSLSRSIDKGLAASSFGIVVISPAFLAKDWPDYELRGLLAKGVGSNSIILPIWHNVTKAEVLAFSPSLADIKALSTTTRSVEEIAGAVIDKVRPDLSNGYHRRLAYENLRRRMENVKTEKFDASELKLGPIRHGPLPRELRNRIRLIHEAFASVMKVPYEETETNFRRDQHPLEEVRVWEAMAAAFLMVGAPQWDYKQQKLLLGALLLRIAGDFQGAAENLVQLPQDFAERAIEAMNEATRS